MPIGIYHLNSDFFFSIKINFEHYTAFFIVQIVICVRSQNTSKQKPLDINYNSSLPNVSSHTTLLCSSPDFSNSAKQGSVT